MSINKLFNFFIAIVWLLNGLVCKVLNGVPRHQEIVGRILGEAYAPILTKTIGASEIVMAIWIVSRFKPRLNAIVQVIIIAVMNVLEFMLAPDLLLWGRFNLVFAFLFIVFILYNEFFIKPVPVKGV